MRRAKRKPITSKTKDIEYDGTYTIWKGYRFKAKRRTIPTATDVREDLWQYCTNYVKKRDGNKCISCGKMCYGFNRQGGHFEPKASGGALLYFHPHNVHVQCGGCNSNEGNRTEYFPAMEKKYGREYTEFLISLKNSTVKADNIFYERVRQFYEDEDIDGLVEWLNNQKNT